MDKNNEENNVKSKNETVILKEKKEDKSISGSTDLTEQNIIIQDIQKNDITLSLNKIIIKKKPHYYNKGKVHMFLYDKNSVPRIVIGPDCKNNFNINFNILFHREIYYYNGIIISIYNNTFLYIFLQIFA